MYIYYIPFSCNLSVAAVLKSQLKNKGDLLHVGQSLDKVLAEVDHKLKTANLVHLLMLRNWKDFSKTVYGEIF